MFPTFPIVRPVSNRCVPVLADGTLPVAGWDFSNNEIDVAAGNIPLTFKRSTEAFSLINNAIIRFAVDVPVINSGGLVIEGPQKNALLDSENFTSTAWTAGTGLTSTLVPGSLIQDGSRMQTRLVDTSTVDGAFVSQTYTWGVSEPIVAGPTGRRENPLAFYSLMFYVEKETSARSSFPCVVVQVQNNGVPARPVAFLIAGFDPVTGTVFDVKYNYGPVGTGSQNVDLVTVNDAGTHWIFKIVFRNFVTGAGAFNNGSTTTILFYPSIYNTDKSTLSNALTGSFTLAAAVLHGGYSAVSSSTQTFPSTYIRSTLTQRGARDMDLVFAGISSISVPDGLSIYAQVYTDAEHTRTLKGFSYVLSSGAHAPDANNQDTLTGVSVSGGQAGTATNLVSVGSQIVHIEPQNRFATAAAAVPNEGPPYFTFVEHPPSTPLAVADDYTGVDTMVTSVSSMKIGSVGHNSVRTRTSTAFGRTYKSGGANTDVLLVGPSLQRNIIVLGGEHDRFGLFSAPQTNDGFATTFHTPLAATIRRIYIFNRYLPPAEAATLAEACQR